MHYVGWDWATETHDVTVLDEVGAVIDRFAVTHDEEGFQHCLGRLAAIGQPKKLAVAIETTNGLAVERLLAAGHPVVPVHPNAFNAARPRWGASRAKSDPGDSLKLADYLRTDGHRLRRLDPPDQRTKELQALVRMRDDHVTARVAATNQLADLLDRHWPGARRIFASLDSEIALSFLDDYPTPGSAARLGEARIAAFCRRHHYSGRRSAVELLDRLRRPPRPGTEIDPVVLAQLVGAQVALVRTQRATIARLNRAIGDSLGRHPKAPLLAPLPRSGSVSLAQVVAEIGPILEHASSAEEANAELGATPVTRVSGKGTASVHFRWAVNKRARKALVTFADNSRHASPWAQQLYSEARRRGKRHPHAVRIVARAWVRVMWACWHDDLAYDPIAHGKRRRGHIQPRPPVAA